MSDAKLEDRIMIAHFKHGPEYAAEELAGQILDWTAGTGAVGGVMGLSGGIDSTTVAYLCKLAFDSYNRENPYKEPLKLLGVIMPSKVNHPDDEKDGIDVAETLGIDYEVIPIQPLADPFIEATPHLFTTDLEIGNLYAVVRANVLNSYAGHFNYRIMGTGNYDEDYVIGYFTKRGDGATDNNVLGNLPKHLVRELASYLGVPDKLVNRTPTAGLWIGQTDEGELGYSYKEANTIHRGFCEGKTAEQIAKITGYDMKIIKDVRHRHKTTEHKRTIPPVGKVTFEYR